MPNTCVGLLGTQPSKGTGNKQTKQKQTNRQIEGQRCEPVSALSPQKLQPWIQTLFFCYNHLIWLVTESRRNRTWKGKLRSTTARTFIRCPKKEKKHTCGTLRQSRWLTVSLRAAQRSRFLKDVRLKGKGRKNKNLDFASSFVVQSHGFRDRAERNSPSDRLVTSNGHSKTLVSSKTECW